MDFEKFEAWQVAFTLVKVADAPEGVFKIVLAGKEATPVMYRYAELKDNGLLEFTAPEAEVKDRRNRVVHGGSYKLTDLGREALPKARRTATRFMNDLIRDNDKLVRKFVNQAHFSIQAFTEREDLYQAGLMAFAHALERFDVRRFSTKSVGKSFPTYLRHWIRHYIQQVVAGTSTIKTPRGQGMPFQLAAKAATIKANTGRVATADELDVTEEQLHEWRTFSPVMVSLDAESGRSHMSDDGHGSYSSFKRAEYEAIGDMGNPESLLEEKEDREDLEEALSVLTPRERLVLEMFNDEHTYDEIGKAIGGVSRVTVFNIRDAAMAKLREELGIEVKN